nr:MAG TPA: YopX protein [Bacteriophage sp.]
MEDRYLFRAKRKKYDSNEEVWVIGSYVHTNDGDYIVVPYKKSTLLGEGKYIEVVPETLCQCTGLKDKNGKLIWENDIMVAHLDDNYPEDETYIRILWHGSGFCSKENGSKDITPVDKFDQEHFEVIGNIFDNAELLESEE